MKITLRTNRNLIQTLIWLLFTIVIYYAVSTTTIQAHNFLVIETVISYFLCIINWKMQGKKLLSIFTMFIVYCFVSNCGQSILYSFTQSRLLMIYRDYSIETICKGLRFQSCCIAALSFGTCLNSTSVRQDELIEYLSSNCTRSKRSFDYIIICLFYASAAYLIYYSVYQIILRQGIGYSELYSTKESASYLFRFLSLACGFYIIFSKKYSKKHSSAVDILWVYLIIAFSIAGTRSLMIMYVAALFTCLPISHPTLFKRRYLAIWVVVIIAFIGMMGVVSATRQSVLAGSLNMSGGILRYFVQAIEEMGGSFRPLIITINANESGIPHYQTVLYVFLHGFFPTGLLSLFGLTEKYVSLPRWMMEYVGVSYTGYGYSMIAEAYMNYGQFGWIFTLVYGWLISWLENKSYVNILEGKYIFSSCALSILCYQVFFARSQLELVLPFYRTSVYILYVWLVFCGFHKRSGVESLNR